MVSKAAMREGILYDMLGRAGADDPRDSSVAALTVRYGIDENQGGRVEATAQRLLAQVAQAWQLDGDDARMLGWAARLHELGLMIAHSQYHVHGSYVLEHSDIAGFSRQEQQVLATRWYAPTAATFPRMPSTPCPIACCCRPGARRRCCGWPSCCIAPTNRTRSRPWS